MSSLEERGAEQLDRIGRDRLGSGHNIAWQEGIEAIYEAGGLPRGSLTGWPSVDALYTVACRQWTLVTGVPGMGKSEFVDALTVNLAETGEWSFAMFSPENYPVVTHAVKLIEKRARKPFGRGLVPRMSKDEMRFAAAWVQAHFSFIGTDIATLMDVVRSGARIGRKTGRKLGIVVDPWNHLNHHDISCRLPGISETEYISNVLSDLVRWLRSDEAGDCHVWVIAHPAKMYRDRDGNVPIPTGYDVAGSAHFFNKADNILCVHRDKAGITQDVDILAQKIRFKHIGQFGRGTIKYDRVTGRYFELEHPTETGELIVDPERGQLPPPAIPATIREPGSDDE